MPASPVNHDCPVHGAGDNNVAGPLVARYPDRSVPVMSNAYAIQGHTRICAHSGRALQPGEKYYSVVLDRAGQFERKDYAAEMWPGAPTDAIAFWSGKVPALHQKRQLTFNDDMLFECFERLAEDTDSKRVQFRYVLALLLLRRKRLRFEDMHRTQGQEYLHLRCSKTNATFEVLDPRLAEADITAVQDEVFKLLGWE